MMEETTQSLLLPSAGRTVLPDDTTNYNNQSEYSMKYPDANDVITANGYGSRIVIAVNRKFPGPAITAYENQKIIVHMRNLMHTDSTTIHFHGMHQKKTPWSDGVAFVSQCPILPGQIYTYKFYGKPFGTGIELRHRLLENGKSY
jgi:FtsP/CotA-like multicopper oxidase with cupredoxin domain